MQCLLGGLVAGAKAGFIYTDWPLMNGAVLAPVEWSKGGLAFLHDHALVQFNHRIWAYGLLIGGTVYAVQAWRWRLAEGLGVSAFVVAGALWLQAALGVVTLINAVPMWLGGLHQAGAAVVLALGDGQSVAGSAVASPAFHVRTPHDTALNSMRYFNTVTERRSKSAH